MLRFRENAAIGRNRSLAFLQLAVPDCRSFAYHIFYSSSMFGCPRPASGYIAAAEPRARNLRGKIRNERQILQAECSFQLTRLSIRSSREQWISRYVTNA